MVAGTTSENEDAIDGFEGIFSLRTEPTGLDSLGAAQHVEGVDDGAGLLEDFLLHVVGIRTQFDGISRKLGFSFFPGDRSTVLTGDVDATRGEDGDIAVLQIHHAAGNLQ